jgi:hypothetical protein
VVALVVVEIRVLRLVVEDITEVVAVVVVEYITEVVEVVV